uniref:Uncharacterized protein n=1 Tax=Spongospora subterranea TaxID=70186 RepID=A0A0H5R4N7_9EUKA|eukprot:CRZ09160.1 hypothetical protein [Spongospora subterranea]
METGKRPPSTLVEAVLIEALTPGENRISLLLLNWIIALLLITLLACFLLGPINIHIVGLSILTVLLAMSIVLFQSTLAPTSEPRIDLGKTEVPQPPLCSSRDKNL